MMKRNIELKPISKEAIPAAMERAMRYRLLNDPWQAESICRDVLRAERGHQEALYMLVLCMTDQFEGKYKKTLQQALAVADDIVDAYKKPYCKGIIFERQAKAALKRAIPRSHFIAYEYLTKAMDQYEEAENNRPPGNEESRLRWNACARMIQHYKLEPSPEEKGMQPFLDV